MDARFAEAWARLDAPANGSERAVGIRRAKTRELIAALAASCEHPEMPARAMSNAIATELLNRQRRAPFMFTFIFSLAFFMMSFVIDAAIFDSPLLTIEGPTGAALAILSAISGSVSLIAWLLWKGALPRLRSRFLRGHY